MFKKEMLRVAAMFAIAVAALTVAVLPAAAQGGIPGGSANPETEPAGGQHITYAAFTGAPTIANGQVNYWAWNENVSGQNILHLRTTTDGTSHTFTGVVNTSGGGNFYNLALVNTTNGDDTTSIVTYNQFTFTIVNNGAAQEGLDVKWSGRWVSLDLYADGYPKPHAVRYGPTGENAKANPLIVNALAQGLLTLPLSTLDGTTHFAKNLTDGYFLYRTNSNLYHMRLTTTSSADLKDYKGKIMTDQGSFNAISIFKGDPRDTYSIVGDTLLKFRFLTKGYEDGLDWRLTQITGLTFTLRQVGKMATPNVWLGSMDPAQPGIPAFTFRLVP